ncbi:MAG: hypothetical protein IPP90_01025 [Gemmatimonadaceae bacterium]|nr:hypothetical protein [Gemmatimonadaceae bacterium]
MAAQRRDPDGLALIVAFDGLLFDTRDVRADALIASLYTEHLQVAPDAVRDALPGRSLWEASEFLVQSGDCTLVDLVALRAQRAVSQRLAQGVSLVPQVREWLEGQRSAGTRLVLRADSIRRDVDRVIQLAEMEFAFTMIRCSDDLPRTIGVSSLENSNAAIARRLHGLGVSRRQTAVVSRLLAAGSGHLCRVSDGTIAERWSDEGPEG